MSDGWPEFSQPTALVDNRAWTAVYDSYDQRNDDCYYEITVTDGGQETARFTARVNIGGADDWTAPAFVEQLRDALSALAESGHSNTDYTARFGRPIWVAAENWDNKLRQEKADK